MKEDTGNLWDFEADATVITTNGFVKNNGEAVMGRGCAREAAQRWPDFPIQLGHVIEQEGNHCHLFAYDGRTIITMPVKHHWREKADMDLILRSAQELVDLADEHWLREVILPRPGCGNGQLDWTDVSMELEAVLDDRFTVVTFN